MTDENLAVACEFGSGLAAVVVANSTGHPLELAGPACDGYRASRQSQEQLACLYGYHLSVAEVPTFINMASSRTCFLPEQAQYIRPREFGESGNNEVLNVDPDLDFLRWARCQMSSEKEETLLAGYLVYDDQAPPVPQLVNGDSPWYESRIRKRSEESDGGPTQRSGFGEGFSHQFQHGGGSHRGPGPGHGHGGPGHGHGGHGHGHGGHGGHGG